LTISQIILPDVDVSLATQILQHYVIVSRYIASIQLLAKIDRESVIYLFNIEILHRKVKLECGPMPNVMDALPNIGGVLCESSVIPRPKVWLTPASGVPSSNAANIRERKTRT